MIERREYEAPAMAEIGTLHELTLLNKDFTGIDGIVLQPGNIPLGNT